jgi:CRISPR-associated protein Csd1
MGLLQWAVETYDHNAGLAGVIVEDDRQPLTPVSHLIQNVQLEITISDTGEFVAAVSITDKNQCKTIIPVTEESASRTSRFVPHPLCDNLSALSPVKRDNYDAYLTQLTAWARSPHSHATVRAVLAYVQKETILEDLARCALLELKEDGTPDGGIAGTPWEKCMVRWRIMPAPDGGRGECWLDQSLFAAYQSWYAERRTGTQDICLLTGETGIPATNHPKGVLGSDFGAKLISANDSSGFTYRGRFSGAEQAGGVGYIASQKAHSALRWVVANQGVLMGGRTFLCWNPAGAPVPAPAFLGFAPEEPTTDPVSYRRQLKDTLSGYQNCLSEVSDSTVVLAALEAATTGRLSVTYYNALTASDFLTRLNRWFDSCVWYANRGKTIQSPPIRQIINCAFGTEQGDFIQTDDRIMREHAQRLVHCVADCQPVPVDFVHALTNRASTPQAYKNERNRELLLSTACAVIRKYHNDKVRMEEWKMALDKENRNRSYLFGRLLAVAEQVERRASGYEEERETNAMRLRSRFCKCPMKTWGDLEEKLDPYYTKLHLGSRNLYKDIVGEITEKLPTPDDPSLNKPLDDVYLLGYYLQRTELTRPRKTDTADEQNNNEEENDDERTGK